MPKPRDAALCALASWSVLAFGCASPDASTEPADEEPTLTMVPLTKVGEFEVTVDGERGTMDVSAVIRREDGSAVVLPPLRTLSATPISDVPSSSSGVPSGGGIVAFSPSGSTTTGCAPGASVCGPIRLVNRTIGRRVARNVYAVITSITPGVTVISDPDRTDFGSKVTKRGGGLLYYEHLAPSGYPSEAATPPAVRNGFRFDRVWNFVGGTSFSYRFDVMANLVACTPSGPDVPGTIDRDCDGVPGASRDGTAIFVDASRGSDSAANDGSLRLPYRSIRYAQARLGGPRTKIVAASRTYTESDWLDLDAGSLRELLGGYDGDDGFTRASYANKSTLVVTDNAYDNGTATTQHRFAMLRRNPSAPPLFVQGWTIVGPDAKPATPTLPAGSAYGLYYNNGAQLVFDQTTIRAGRGGAGYGLGGAATAGLPGVNAAGQGGAGRGCPTGTTYGGNGGTGGYGSGSYGYPGTYGYPNYSCNQGGPYSSSYGNSGYTCGGTGSPGSNGIAPGAPTVSFYGTAGNGTISLPYVYQIYPNQNGGSGTNGYHGPGGGGGGGGGGYTYYQYQPCGSSYCYVPYRYYGGNGGGGGSGGCGGTGGRGGTAGGASVAILHYTSSTNRLLFQSAVALETAGAGTGGPGQQGGAGGNPGAGAYGTSYGYYAGGRGGNGTRGGPGGWGLGGNGGPTACIASYQNRLPPSGTSCAPGPQASGGSPSGYAGIRTGLLSF